MCCSLSSPTALFLSQNLSLSQPWIFQCSTKPAAGAIRAKQLASLGAKKNHHHHQHPYHDLGRKLRCCLSRHLLCEMCLRHTPAFTSPVWFHRVSEEDLLERKKSFYYFWIDLVSQTDVLEVWVYIDLWVKDVLICIFVWGILLTVKSRS